MPDALDLHGTLAHLAGLRIQAVHRRGNVLETRLHREAIATLAAEDSTATLMGGISERPKISAKFLSQDCASYPAPPVQSSDKAWQQHRRA